MRPDGLAGQARLEVVVPAHNEAERIAGGLAVLSEKLAGTVPPGGIIVVDNASMDDTAGIAGSWSGPVPVRLIRCPEPGKGAAVRAGLLATTAPYVGFCDADMATDLAALDDALALLRSGRQVVIGSRRHPGSDVQVYRRPLRRVGALVFNRLARDVTGGVSDTQCGFKFFAGPLARAVAAELRTTGFAFDVEFLLRCRHRGAGAWEIPVVWRDMPGSTFSPARHSASCLRDLLRIHAMARRPAPALVPDVVPAPAPVPDVVPAPVLRPVIDELRAG